MNEEISKILLDRLSEQNFLLGKIVDNLERIVENTNIKYIESKESFTKKTNLWETEYGKKLCYIVALKEDGKTKEEILTAMKSKDPNFKKNIAEFQVDKVFSTNLKLPPNKKKEDFL